MSDGKAVGAVLKPGLFQEARGCDPEEEEFAIVREREVLASNYITDGIKGDSDFTGANVLVEYNDVADGSRDLAHTCVFEGEVADPYRQHQPGKKKHIFVGEGEDVDEAIRSRAMSCSDQFNPKERDAGSWLDWMGVEGVAMFAEAANHDVLHQPGLLVVENEYVER
ncbi:uncharacterized protein UTRI_05969 [Ustilago trichophora]|uniref:Uncharacterized protein n=1 Tax=Ustilago trichophora TaxID=86804 RepID=A0A5C3EIT0_9BASI|nr:uncharacterized protein UTRI_05969 [Ustilago trichophora]